jgi:pimeloyl-ACP methyl ester carboxylesterase
VADANINGITISYEASGNPAKPAVLLNMGLGLQLVSWPPAFVDGLVEMGYYVIRYDNRDAGLSSKFDHLGAPRLWLAYLKTLAGLKLKAAYTLQDMAADACGLLSYLGIPRAHIIGVSMGGMVSQIFAARYPKRTLSLTSIMSSSGRPGLPGPTPAARRVLLSSSPPAGTREQLIEYMANTFNVIGSPAYPMPEAYVREMCSRAVDRNVHPDGASRQLVAIVASGDRSKLLRSLQCPALVIHGTDDPLVPAACGIDTAEQIPGARLELIEGMGHDLPPQLIGRLLALIGSHMEGKMAAPQPSPADYLEQD